MQSTKQILANVKTLEDWRLLDSASRNNKEAFIEIFKRIPDAFISAGAAIKNDDRLVELALSVNGYFIQYCPRKYWRNIEFANIVANSTPLALYKMDASIFDNREFMIHVAKSNPKVIVLGSRKMPSWIYNDAEIMDHVLMKMPAAFPIMGIEYRSQASNIEKALALNIANYTGIPEDIKLENPQYALQALSKIPSYWRYVPTELRNDREFVSQAIDLNPAVVEHIYSDELEL